jgi:hypothetical protein
MKNSHASDIACFAACLPPSGLQLVLNRPFQLRQFRRGHNAGSSSHNQQILHSYCIHFQPSIAIIIIIIVIIIIIIIIINFVY